MKAVVCNKYGGPEVLSIENRPDPKPEANEVLIRVHNAGLTAADTFLRKGEPRFARLFTGLQKPKASVIGTCFSGTVIKVGSAVNRFQIGDAVFGEAGLSFGANAELLTVAEDQIIRKIPEFLSFESAALLCDGPLASFNFLTNVTTIKKNQAVLIIGASGSLGTAAVQIAKAIGAQVTGVCSSRNAAFVQSLGADQVIAYDETPLEQIQSKYHVIFDTIRAHRFKEVRHLLKGSGVYLTPVLKFSMISELIMNSFRGGKKVKFSATGLLKPPVLQGMLGQVLKLIKKGDLRVTIEKRYALQEVVAAHQHIETGRKRGNIVLQVYPNRLIKPSSTAIASESEKAILA
ncbi:MAG: NAD(P)-dependent alcohol dehydrogenase [Bacteroidota bacterium]